MKESLQNKINQKKSVIGVLGLGQVGLPTALTFCQEGFSVIGHDINSSLLKLLEQGKLSFEEEGLEELLHSALKKDIFHLESNLEITVKNCDIIIICVATPLTSDIRPDLSALENVCKALSELCLEGKLILIESSIPPNTFREIIVPIIGKNHNIGKTCWAAFVPERFAPGQAINEIRKTPRIIGQLDSESGILAKTLYQNIVDSEIFVTSVEVAEISKLVENTYRDVNVALANEIALICENYGIDVEELRQVCNSHPRVNLLNPGPGVGGPCLPKDPYLLLNPRGKNPIKSNIIIHSRKINDQMPLHVVDLVEKGLEEVNKKLDDSSITVLGVTYKANVSDTRYSPASKIIPSLLQKNAKISVYDPFSEETFGGASVSNIWDSISNSDLILVLTDHLEFSGLTLEKIKEKMNKPLIVDCRRIFDKSKAEELGINYIGIGLRKK